MPKLPKNWLPFSNIGNVIPKTRIICFKVPLQQGYNFAANFTPDDVMRTVELQGCTLGCVIDLTNTDKYYSGDEFRAKGIRYVKLACPGSKEESIPPDSLVEQFITEVEEFLRSNDDPSCLIGVHCTHGVNRTGYIVCNYLMKRLRYSAAEAIGAFQTARGHSMEKYTSHLFQMEEDANEATRNQYGEPATSSGRRFYDEQYVHFMREDELRRLREPPQPPIGFSSKDQDYRVFDLYDFPTDRSGLPLSPTSRHGRKRRGSRSSDESGSDGRTVSPAEALLASGKRSVDSAHKHRHKHKHGKHHHRRHHHHRHHHHHHPHHHRHRHHRHRHKHGSGGQHIDDKDKTGGKKAPSPDKPVAAAIVDSSDSEGSESRSFEDPTDPTSLGSTTRGVSVSVSEVTPAPPSGGNVSSFPTIIPPMMAVVTPPLNPMANMFGMMTRMAMLQSMARMITPAQSALMGTFPTVAPLSGASSVAPPSVAGSVPLQFVPNLTSSSGSSTPVQGSDAVAAASLSSNIAYSSGGSHPVSGVKVEPVADLAPESVRSMPASASLGLNEGTVDEAWPPPPPPDIIQRRSDLAGKSTVMTPAVLAVGGPYSDISRDTTPGPDNSATDDDDDDDGPDRPDTSDRASSAAGFGVDGENPGADWAGGDGDASTGTSYSRNPGRPSRSNKRRRRRQHLNVKYDTMKKGKFWQIKEMMENEEERKAEAMMQGK